MQLYHIQYTEFIKSVKFSGTSFSAQKVLNYLCCMENVCLKPVFLASHRSDAEYKLAVHLELAANLRAISHHNALLRDRAGCA